MAKFRVIDITTERKVSSEKNKPAYIVNHANEVQI